MALAKQMKKTVMKTTKEVVTNKYVLYVVLFIALTNVLAYLGTSNYIGLAIFSLIGLLTSYFTKNMTIILLVTIVVSSFIHISRRTVEGMKNKESKKKVKGVEEDEINDGESAEVSDEDEDEDDEPSNDDMPVMPKGSKVNHQKTVEESYKNLHSILGNDNFKKMTKDTSKLLEQQNKLTDSLNTMAPLLESAQGMLKGFDMDKINSMMNSLGAAVPQDKKKN